MTTFSESSFDDICYDDCISSEQVSQLHSIEIQLYQLRSNCFWLKPRNIDQMAFKIAEKILAHAYTSKYLCDCRNNNCIQYMRRLIFAAKLELFARMSRIVYTPIRMESIKTQCAFYTLQIGKSFYFCDEFEGAAKYYTESLALRSEKASTNWWLSRLHMVRGRWFKALKCVSHAVRIKPHVFVYQRDLLFCQKMAVCEENEQGYEEEEYTEQEYEEQEYCTFCGKTFDDDRDCNC